MKRKIEKQREKIAAAYRKHRGTNCGCETTREGKCTQCHFYQGGVAALNEVLGDFTFVSIPLPDQPHTRSVAQEIHETIVECKNKDPDV